MMSFQTRPTAETPLISLGKLNAQLTSSSLVVVPSLSEMSTAIIICIQTLLRRDFWKCSSTVVGT